MGAPQLLKRQKSSPLSSRSRVNCEDRVWSRAAVRPTGRIPGKYLDAPQVDGDLLAPQGGQGSLYLFECHFCVGAVVDVERFYSHWSLSGPSADWKRSFMPRCVVRT